MTQDTGMEMGMEGQEEMEAVQDGGLDAVQDGLDDEMDLSGELAELEMLADQAVDSDDANEDMESLLESIESSTEGKGRKARRGGSGGGSGGSGGSGSGGSGSGNGEPEPEFDDEGWPNVLTKNQKAAFAEAGILPGQLPDLEIETMLAVRGIGPNAVRKLRGEAAIEAVKKISERRKARSAEEKAKAEEEKRRLTAGYAPLSTTCRKAEALGYSAADVVHGLCGGEPKNPKPLFESALVADCSRFKIAGRYYVTQELYDNLAEVIQEMKAKKARSESKKKEEMEEGAEGSEPVGGVGAGEGDAAVDAVSELIGDLN